LSATLRIDFPQRRAEKEKGRSENRNGQGNREETPIRAAAPKRCEVVFTLQCKKLKIESIRCVSFERYLPILPNYEPRLLCRA
jgi:hypothetical protein